MSKSLEDEIQADAFLKRFGILDADPYVKCDKEYVIAQMRIAFLAGWGAANCYRDYRGDGEGFGYRRRQDDHPSLTAQERNPTLR